MLFHYSETDREVPQEPLQGMIEMFIQIQIRQLGLQKDQTSLM